jgi:urease beta subunit
MLGWLRSFEAAGLVRFEPGVERWVRTVPAG